MKPDFGSVDKALSISPENGREMILLTRHIIREWVNDGLPYPIDDLDVLVGIESQSDHLLDGKVKKVFGLPPKPMKPSKEEEELEDLYEFFKERYEVARVRLTHRLNLERP